MVNSGTTLYIRRILSRVVERDIEDLFSIVSDLFTAIKDDEFVSINSFRLVNSFPCIRSTYIAKLFN